MANFIIEFIVDRLAGRSDRLRVVGWLAAMGAAAWLALDLFAAARPGWTRLAPSVLALLGIGVAGFADWLDRFGPLRPSAQ